ncbi:MAG: polyphosphate kinase 2, partial [Magnetococcales bacterium]|nr:polyphosphate kinase 2 [Magnetococcales bacterium]
MTEKKGAHEGRTAQTAMRDEMTEAEYLQQIKPLHIELVKMQNWVKAEGKRIVALFEGRDTSGKGGTIKRMTEHMNPRGCRVVALGKPSAKEETQWYLQRYIGHLPSAGEVVLFDRSWYSRAAVERVMGFCSEKEVQEFLRSAPFFEQMLVRSGVILFKFYFSVDKAEQKRRLERRMNDPLKWRAPTLVEREAQAKWDAYTHAKEEIFAHTATESCPWTVVKSGDKRRARIECIKYWLSQLDYTDKIADLAQYDTRLVRTIISDTTDGQKSRK